MNDMEKMLDDQRNIWREQCYLAREERDQLVRRLDELMQLAEDLFDDCKVRHDQCPCCYMGADEFEDIQHFEYCTYRKFKEWKEKNGH